MALTRSKQNQLGSAQWAQDERLAMNQAVSNELEDFYYSAYNEFDWLNEKMEEVFSKDARTLTDVFKTPGKLRGKTPKSVRKFNAITPRQPLADIFAPNAQSTAIKAPRSSLGKHPRLEFEEDVENQQPAKKHSSRKDSPQRVGKPGNTDSGYHGLTEDEMESHRNTQHTQDEKDEAQNVASHEDVEHSSDQSFSSARENVMIAQKAAQQQLEDEMAAERELAANKHTSASVELQEPQEQIETDTKAAENVEDATIEDVFETDRPLQRKSSFNFSSLPAREPLLSKKSLGPRVSQYAHGTTSLLPQSAAIGASRQTGSGQGAEAVESAKTSTQRLHERITLLGKTRETVLPKEIAPVVAYPELSQHQPAQVADKARDRGSDDWIKPSVSQHSTSQDTSVSRPQTAASVTDTAHRVLQPNKAAATSSTTLASQASSTPAGSPAAKRQYEGPLSSSKNKLMSVFKMGRSLFASSASTSAAAKLEAHTTTPSRPSPTREFSNESSFSVNMPGALHSEATLAKSPSRPLSIMSFGSTRKSRKSGETDRKEESKAQQKSASDLEKAREMERAKVAAEQAHAQELRDREAEQKAAESKAKAESSKTAMPLVGKLKSVGRPVRPVKEAAKEKPAPINIKVTSQLQHREEPPARATSVRPSSAHSTLKSSTAQIPNSRVRALEAAQRKKDLEEKAKQKKADQKRELERKRLAKQEEEERKAEQERKAEEQRRAHEAKIAAQKQAEKQVAEARRREEQQRREQQQRLEAQRQQEEKAKAEELAEIIARERAQQQTQSRTDLTGTLRSLAQKTFGDSSRPPIQMNPAKPPKRNVQDAEEQRTAAQQSYQQDGAKRRKTDEMEENGHRASVMAPPKRPSTIRKETITRFPHGYSQAAPSHPPTSMFKSAVTNQYQPSQKTATGHPSQLVQMSNARIAFADNQPQSAVPSGHPEVNKHKTPVRPAPVSAKSAAKSSPMYPNGDNITLPEIATDSEEEPESDDEDNGFRAPSWVASPALRELIARQQLVDPETVFGPIAELKMEEVFKGAKGDRLKKFRDRGSSAAWVQNGDAVTSAEKQRDMEMREAIARQGHWSYQPGL